MKITPWIAGMCTCAIVVGLAGEYTVLAKGFCQMHSQLCALEAPQIEHVHSTTDASTITPR
jgi:hypothetical protein